MWRKSLVLAAHILALQLCADWTLSIAVSQLGSQLKDAVHQWWSLYGQPETHPGAVLGGRIGLPTLIL